MDAVRVKPPKDSTKKLFFIFMYHFPVVDCFAVFMTERRMTDTFFQKAWFLFGGKRCF